MMEDAKGDSCEMCGAIKQVLPGTKKSTVSSIFENGKWHTENLSVAKIMNQYFVSVGKVLAKPFQKLLLPLILLNSTWIMLMWTSSVMPLNP